MIRARQKLLKTLIFISILTSFAIFLYLNQNFGNSQIISSKTDVNQLSQLEKDLLVMALAKYDNNVVDFQLLGQQLRLLKKLYNNKFKSKLELENYLMLEKKLFNWFLPPTKNLEELKNSFKGKGIVMCVGEGKNGYLHIAYSTIDIIRRIFKSNIEIEIFYLGEKDLKLENRQIFEKNFKNLRFVNLEEKVDNKFLELKGFELKPFAMLFSSFERVLLMDSDTIFLQNPEKLFQFKSFLYTGSLFFHDRTYQGDLWGLHKTVKFIRSFLPTNIPKKVQDLHIMNLISGHEQESGVVLIDKSRHFFSLLATCSLLKKYERKLTFYYVYGDKETFWIGFAAMEEDFSFINEYKTGILGVSKKKSVSSNSYKYVICNPQMLHLDENDEPLWINGGLTFDKSGSPMKSKNNLLQFKEYLHEPGYWYNNGLGGFGKDFCLETKNRSPIEFNVTFLENFELMKSLYLEAIKKFF